MGVKNLLLLLFLITFAAALSFAQQKFALVIGNGNYANIAKLNNPVNDANDVAAALQELGFTVDKVLNGTLDQMESAAIRLKNRLSTSKNSYGFLFYAGHGIQSNGENYLIPVDANIQSESFLRQRAVSVQSMLNELNEAGNELNMVVLDACRDNPFSWNRSGNRGLRAVENQPADSILVFATAAGSTAKDGTGRNGLFTSYLLKYLKIPGLEVSEVFRLTMGDVIRASNSQQRPAVYNQFSGLAYLGTRPTFNTPTQPTPVQQPAPVVPPASRSTPASVVQPAQQSAPAVQSAAMPIRPAPDNFVRINGGTFTIGSPANEPKRNIDEGPQHQVTVSSFYMGKYEVTQKEYQEIMGTNHSNFKGDNLPVENISWYDAIEYCNKRSQKEGLTPAYTRDGDDIKWNRNANGYRLPTEAEWEYACRAGTKTPFSTGNNITTSQANYDGNNPYNNNAKGEYRQKTTLVGSFIPNGWGLYDMHGNVWEWCWDLKGTYPSGAQTDPAGSAVGDSRVIRGGSWSNVASYTRSAYRHDNYPSYRGSSIGFRLVRNA